MFGNENFQSREELYHKFVKFLLLHQEKSIHSAGFNTNEIREVLIRALKEFPKNTYFLNALSWSERKTKIENRVGLLLEGFIERFFLLLNVLKKKFSSKWFVFDFILCLAQFTIIASDKWIFFQIDIWTWIRRFFKITILACFLVLLYSIWNETK